MKDIEKKLTFADFLLSQGDAKIYASAAFKHVLSAATLLVKELTDLDENSINSPQIIKQTLKRFKDSNADDFAKFYINLLSLSAKPTISVSDIEDLVRRTRGFVNWVQNQKF